MDSWEVAAAFFTQGCARIDMVRYSVKELDCVGQGVADTVQCFLKVGYTSFNVRAGHSTTCTKSTTPAPRAHSTLRTKMTLTPAHHADR